VILLFSAYWTRHAVTPLHDRDIHVPATNPMIPSASVLSPTAKLQCRVKTARESLHGPVIWRGLWPQHSPDFNNTLRLICGGVSKIKLLNKFAQSGRTKKQHTPSGFNNIRGRTQSKRPQVYGVHPVSRATLSASAVALESCC
jgi:hypothetical protein